jgi:hypothetical protein
MRRVVDPEPTLDTSDYEVANHQSPRRGRLGDGLRSLSQRAQRYRFRPMCRITPRLTWVRSPGLDHIRRQEAIVAELK